MSIYQSESISGIGTHRAINSNPTIVLFWDYPTQIAYQTLFGTIMNNHMIGAISLVWLDLVETTSDSLQDWDILTWDLDDTCFTMAIMSFEMFCLETLILNLPYQLVTTELIASRAINRGQWTIVTRVRILVTDYHGWPEPRKVDDIVILGNMASRDSPIKIKTIKVSKNNSLVTLSLLHYAYISGNVPPVTSKT